MSFLREVSMRTKSVWVIGLGEFNDICVVLYGAMDCLSRKSHVDSFLPDRVKYCLSLGLGDRSLGEMVLGAVAGGLVSAVGVLVSKRDRIQG